ncbi:MAG TPA: amino acid adenylation domain-containing protein, partial [Candidatus Deferrimicrobium sp.]|nr:amino acid adenylation domain-containing protein [Candidatus Deferrimicrobium sp.]
TYAELEQRAACISQWIADRNIPPGSFIGIYIDSKIDIISVIIGILQRGCIFVPLGTALPGRRVENMVRLTNMRVIVTDTLHETIAAGMKEKGCDIAHICVLTDSFDRSPGADENMNPGIIYDPGDKLYVYFTSGTTGVPNAILGRNKSLVQFIQWEIETFAVAENDRIGQLTTVGFDPFLRDIFVPLLAGGAVCIPGNKDILMDGNNLVDWLDESQITLVHCVPSLFRIIIDAGKLTPALFPRLKYVLLHGEPIKPNELQGWYRVFNHRIQLGNYYGPTETTLATTFHFITMSDIEAGRIPVGRPIRGSRTIILDRHTKICDRGIMGEIYIRTAYSTYGYLNNPELNAQRFIKNPFNAEPGDIIYKTGDLGRELENGELEVLGRIDRQVKIRGVRIELENIENCLLKHSQIERAIVISRKSGAGENFLCAYMVFKKQETPDQTGSIPATSELRKHLAKDLPDYMIPSYFIPIEEVPLNPNGKVDIKALPEPGIKSDGSYIAPRNAMEEKLVELWGEVLGIGKEVIGIESNFFELGGHSLKVITLIAKIHRELDVRIPVDEIFKTPHIKGLAEFIKHLATGQPLQDKYAAIEPTEEKEYYPLSSAQKRLYFLQQLDLNGTGYNMPRVLSLDKEIEKDRLEAALKQLIDRHESLRTSFQWVNEEVVQVVHKNVQFKVEYFATDEHGQTQTLSKVKSFIRPFDLSRAPLIRSGLIKQPDGNYTWLVDTHHIVSDGTSLTILTEDFMRLYRGETQLEPLDIRYRDFAHWQNRLFESGAIESQEKYWLALYEGELPRLDLPTDSTRPAVFTFAGDSYGFKLTGKEVVLFKALCRQSGGTLYMNMLAALNTLFYKYTGQEDIIIGSGIAGRRHANLQGIVGMFVNTLAMRNYPEAEMSYN